MCKADLSGAKMSRANLSAADLSGAKDVTDEQLLQARSLQRCAVILNPHSLLHPNPARRMSRNLLRCA